MFFDNKHKSTQEIYCYFTATLSAIDHFVLLCSTVKGKEERKRRKKNTEGNKNNPNEITSHFQAKTSVTSLSLDVFLRNIHFFLYCSRPSASYCKRWMTVVVEGEWHKWHSQRRIHKHSSVFRSYFIYDLLASVKGSNQNLIFVR